MSDHLGPAPYEEVYPDGDSITSGLVDLPVFDLVRPDARERRSAPDLLARRPRITWADTIEPEPVEWVWETDGVGRIPTGALVVAAGREGTGKSSFGFWLTAQITRGLLPGAYFGVPRPVFIVAAEDSWPFTIVPRLIASGADRSLVGRFDVVTAEDDCSIVSLPRDIEALGSEVVKEGVGLVMLDPLISLIGEGIDTHKERATRLALDPLARLADETHTLMLGIAHFNKSAMTDPSSLITGSGAFKNVPRAIFGFARDGDEGERIMSQLKNSLGREDLPSLTYAMQEATVDTDRGVAKVGKFVFTGTSARSVEDVLRDSRSSTDDETERDQAVEWLLDYIANNGGEARAGEALKAAERDGFSKTTIHRARKKAGVESRKSRKFDGGWVWAFPDTEDSTKGPKIPRLGTTEPSEPSSTAGICTRCERHSPRRVPAYDRSGDYCPPCCIALNDERHRDP